MFTGLVSTIGLASTLALAGCDAVPPSTDASVEDPIVGTDDHGLARTPAAKESGERDGAAAVDSAANETETGDSEPIERSDTTEAEAADARNGPSGFTIEDGVVGDGARVRDRSFIVARFRGLLVDGTVFDADEAARGPWPLDALVPGLARGLVGMAVGGTRTITIPPELAYGDEAVIDAESGETRIPSRATIVYEVELLEVIDGEPPVETEDDA